uniref:Dicarboxylate transport domain-containing protein n=1 Tax=Chlorobium chlorochromatii (strain CaD3) TaxID=340177 RepID=Q3ARR8_CHLCH
MRKKALSIALASLLLLGTSLPIAAWLALPRYVEPLLQRALIGKPVQIAIKDVRPSLHGVAFSSLQATITTPPDECNNYERTIYHVTIKNGTIGWLITDLSASHRSPFIPSLLDVKLHLQADTLHLQPTPNTFAFSDSQPEITVNLKLFRNEKQVLSVVPLDAAYAIHDGTVTREQMRFEGIAYNVAVSSSNKWQQLPDSLFVARMVNEGKVQPVGNFRAIVGSKGDPLHPCRITLSNCSAEIVDWNASSPFVHFDRKTKAGDLTLCINDFPLQSLSSIALQAAQQQPKAPSRLAAKAPLPPMVAGKINATIPLSFRDSTIVIRNASVIAKAGAKVVLYNKQQQPMLFVVANKSGMDERIVDKLYVTATLNHAGKTTQSVALQNLSATIFDGSIRSTPLTVKTDGSSPLDVTVTFDNLKLFDHLILPDNEQSSFQGALSGKLPIRYAKNQLTIRNASLLASEGTQVKLVTKEQKPLVTIIAGKKGGKETVLDKLNVRARFNQTPNQTASITLQEFSTTLFGGSVNVTPLTFKTDASSPLVATVTLDKVKLFEHLILPANLHGSLYGDLSGKVPLTYQNDQLSISNATLRSSGGGSFTLNNAQQSSNNNLSRSDQQTTYAFSEPALTFSHLANGATTVDFTLNEFRQKSGSNDFKFGNPKGTIHFAENPREPDVMRLSNFSTNFFGGKIALNEFVYDIKKQEGETIVQLSNMPLQKLLDLQGTKKVYATGALKGNIPIKLKKGTVEIPDGALLAQESGQIIYATSPEERAAAHQSLRTTYEVLSNFLYQQLSTSLTMTPDGQSTFAIRLKGTNPDMYGARPVELNLNVQQNLLDLMRTLSISSEIEQAISDKTTQQQKK